MQTDAGEEVKAATLDASVLGKPHQAIFSWGIVFRNPLIAALLTRFPKSRFDKIGVFLIRETMRLTMRCVWPDCKKTAPLKGPWYCTLHRKVKQMQDEARAKRIIERLGA